jgi:hypothetical protein
LKTPTWLLGKISQHELLGFEEVNFLAKITKFMNMNNEQRLIEVMSELLPEVHEMRLEIKGMRDDFNTRTGRLENEQTKTNLGINELRLSVMKLADFGDRILRLETEVFKRAS